MVKKLLKEESAEEKLKKLHLHLRLMFFIIAVVGYSNTQKKRKGELEAAASNQTEYFRVHKLFSKYVNLPKAL